MPITVAPGSVVQVRDEEWLVSTVEQTDDGQLLTVQGLSDLVRGTTEPGATVIGIVNSLVVATACLGTYHNITVVRQVAGVIRHPLYPWLPS